MIARPFRRLIPRRLPQWEIKVTSRDGTLLHLDTELLYTAWRFGSRTNDGFIDLLETSLMVRFSDFRVWMKPKGWTEPDRTAQLDGTSALPKGLVAIPRDWWRR